MRRLLFAFLALCCIAPVVISVESNEPNRTAMPGSSQDSLFSVMQEASDGNASAQHKLGVMYYRGDGVPQDYNEAIKWFIKAAEQGDAKGQYILGLMYDNGEGVPQDYNEAVKWFTKAAEQGNAPSQGKLGVMYAQGTGVTQDYKEAVKWFTKAAEQGEANAQFDLSWMYDIGTGVPQDYKEAVKWCAKAAEQGLAEAQFNLGWKYDTGEGVRQDYKKAVKWYTKAAEQGDAKAQFNLGVMYAKGTGVRDSYVEAYKWFVLAAAQENEDAAEARDLLKSEMPASQIVEAQRRSRDFKPRVTSPATRGVVNPQSVVNDTAEFNDELRRTRVKAKVAELKHQIDLAGAKIQQLYRDPSSVETLDVVNGETLKVAKEKWTLFSEQARCYKKLISLAERNPDLGLDVLGLKKKLIECEDKIKHQQKVKKKLRDRSYLHSG